MIIPGTIKSSDQRAVKRFFRKFARKALTKHFPKPKEKILPTSDFLYLEISRQNKAKPTSIGPATRNDAIENTEEKYENLPFSHAEKNPPAPETADTIRVTTKYPPRISP